MKPNLSMGNGCFTKHPFAYIYIYTYIHMILWYDLKLVVLISRWIIKNNPFATPRNLCSWAPMRSQKCFCSIEVVKWLKMDLLVGWDYHIPRWSFQMCFMFTPKLGGRWTQFWRFFKWVGSTTNYSVTGIQISWSFEVWWYIYGCFLKWWENPPFHTSKWSCLVGKPMVVGYHGTTI